MRARGGACDRAAGLGARPGARRFCNLLGCGERRGRRQCHSRQAQCAPTCKGERQLTTDRQPRVKRLARPERFAGLLKRLGMAKVDPSGLARRPRRGGYAPHDERRALGRSEPSLPRFGPRRQDRWRSALLRRHRSRLLAPAGLHDCICPRPCFRNICACGASRRARSWLGITVSVWQESLLSWSALSWKWV